MSNTELSVQSGDNEQRPANLIERIRLDLELFKLHLDRDFSSFLVDEKGKKLPKDILFEVFVIVWFEHLPIYTNEHFASCVMRHFSDASAVEVAPAIEKWFPDFDTIDIEYFNNILDEIEGRLVDLQDDFTITGGIPGYVYETLNLIIYPTNRLNRNLAIARKVLKSIKKQIRDSLLSQSNDFENRLKSTNIARVPNALLTQTVNPPAKLGPAPIQWDGSIAELSALIIELSEKGYIKLPGQTTSYNATWEEVCRGITSLFELTTRRESSKGEAWETLATYFKTKEVEFKTHRTVYPKLESSRAKFSQIESRRLALDNP